jgi:hypothetical protein
MAAHYSNIPLSTSQALMALAKLQLAYDRKVVRERDAFAELCEAAEVWWPWPDKQAQLDRLRRVYEYYHHLRRNAQEKLEKHLQERSVTEVLESVAFQLDLSKKLVCHQCKVTRVIDASLCSLHPVHFHGHLVPGEHKYKEDGSMAWFAHGVRDCEECLWCFYLRYVTQCKSSPSP